ISVATGVLWSVALSPDGKTAALACDSGPVKLVDVDNMRERAGLQGHVNVLGVAFAPDGKTLASCGDDAIRLWDLSAGPEKAHAKVLRQPGSFCVAFSPDGKTLASGETNAVRLWDVATGKERAALQGHGSWIWAVAFSPDGKTLA